MTYKSWQDLEEELNEKRKKMGMLELDGRTIAVNELEAEIIDVSLHAATFIRLAKLFLKTIRNIQPSKLFRIKHT